jgi:hypothetical protein
VSAEDRDLERFLGGDVAAADLPHREHVRLAFEILRRHDFLESAQRYSAALRVIAERLAAQEAHDFAGFAARNPDLMDRGVLGRWYAPERLTSPLARGTFLLPDPRR